MMKAGLGAALICIAFTVSASGRAAPIAPLPQLSASGQRLMHAIGQTRVDLEQSIPSKAVVGVPAYPGAYFVSSDDGNDGTERPMLPTVTLVSSDPPGKINAWYQHHLVGWSWDPNYEAFFQGAHGLTDVRKLFTTPHVSVQPASPSPDAALYHLPNMRSRIEIAYRPISPAEPVAVRR